MATDKRRRLHETARSETVDKRRLSPRNMGALVDLYLRIHRLKVVTNNYLLNNSITEEEKEEILDKKVEALYSLIEAYKHIDPLMLPRWRSLPEELKQVFRMAACGNRENAFALSCNLGHRTATRAMKASRGASDYLGRKLRDVLQSFCSGEEIALIVENVIRKGGNSGIHFHAVICVSEDQLPHLKAALRNAFASDYIEVCNNQAIFLRPIYEPGGWAGYCNKWRYENENLGKRFFSSKKASRSGEKLYREFTTWQKKLRKQLQHPDELRAEVRMLITGSAEPKPCPELMLLLKQHEARREEMRQRGLQLVKYHKQLAANDPRCFAGGHLQHVCEHACDAIKTPAEVLSELAGAANRASAGVYSASRTKALGGRYSDRGNFGVWASSEDEDEPLFGYHPEPES
jgi:hypothetical protein